MGSCLGLSLSWWSACPAVAGSLGVKVGAYNPIIQVGGLNFKVTLAVSSSRPFWDTGGAKGGGVERHQGHRNPATGQSMGSCL